MALAVFCHHCGLPLHRIEGDEKDAPHWLICGHCKKNSCGPTCSNGCWGAELLQSDTPVQEQAAVEATNPGKAAEQDGLTPCGSGLESQAHPRKKIKKAMKETRMQVCRSLGKVATLSTRYMHVM